MGLNDPVPGALLGAKYRVQSVLGAGAMGRVLRAQNELTGKAVALKWMHPEVASTPNASERLLREARAAAQLKHPNVVDIYDIVHEGSTLFLVMELLEGETLSAFLRRNPQPPLSEFIALLLQALEGVAAAHDRGVIHRDLKPDNIFLVRAQGTEEVRVKVVDFGVAKLTGQLAPTITAAGSAVGTPFYMSLEQLRGDRDIDGRSDVYAFGVMLYEAITGRMPYRASSLTELAIRVATGNAPPVKQLRPDVPTSLAGIVDRACARDREQRFPSARALIGELRTIATQRGFRLAMTEPAAPLPLVALSEQAGRSTMGPCVPGPPASYVPTVPVDALSSSSLSARETPAPDVPQRRLARSWRVMAAIALGLVLVAAALNMTRRSRPDSVRDGVAHSAQEATHTTETQPPPIAEPMRAEDPRLPPRSDAIPDAPRAASHPAADRATANPRAPAPPKLHDSSASDKPPSAAASRPAARTRTHRDPVEELGF